MSDEYQQAVRAARESRVALEYARDIVADSQRRLREAEAAWLVACDCVDAARRRSA